MNGIPFHHCPLRRKFFHLLNLYIHELPPNSDDAVEPEEAVVFLTENSILFPIQDTDVQDDEEVPIENVSPVEEMLFMDQTIRANLPDFTTVPTVPNQDYNNVDKIRFATTINAIYEDTLHWRKNLFLVPTGKSGKEYIKLKTEWLNKFNTGSSFQCLALKL